MSIRTKLPRAPASRDELLDVRAAQAGVELEPERGELDRDVRVEPLALDPREHLVVGARDLAASPALRTSSPSTSTVAIFPSRFSRATTRTASSSDGPAM